MNSLTSLLLPPASADVAGNRIVPTRLSLWIVDLITVAPGFNECLLCQVFCSLWAGSQLGTETNEPCPFAGECGLSEEGQHRLIACSQDALLSVSAGVVCSPEPYQPNPQK